MPSDIAIRVIVYFVIALALFLSGVKVESWRASAKYDKLVAEYKDATIKAQEQARVQQQAMFTRNERTEQNYVAQVQKTQQSLASANADRDRLRNLVAQFTAYTVPPGATSDGTPAGCSTERGLLARASQLAHEGVQLVAVGDSMADRATQAAEEYRDKLIALQAYVRTVCLKKD